MMARLLVCFGFIGQISSSTFTLIRIIPNARTVDGNRKDAIP